MGETNTAIEQKESTNSNQEVQRQWEWEKRTDGQWAAIKNHETTLEKVIKRIKRLPGRMSQSFRRHDKEQVTGEG